MIRIRLRRGGKKFSPFYSVVVANSRSPRDGKFIEEVGNYDPNKKVFLLNDERVLYWLSVGAQPSETVITLLKKTGIWQKFIISKTKKI